MRAALLVVALLSTGCLTRTSQYVSLGVGVGTMGVGAALVLAEDDLTDRAVSGIGLFLLGSTIVLGTIVTMIVCGRD